MRKAMVFALSALVTVSAMAQQQIKMPRPSPKGVVTQTIGVTDVTVNYSRPSVKGRTIWGDLVPYDKVWRTGANEATTITFSDDVSINGQKLLAGTYSLHTIPGKDSWTIIFNSVADQWGSYSYDATKDALRVTAKPVKAPFSEFLTIDFPEMNLPDSATAQIRWENVAVPFTINADTTNKTLAAMRTALETAKADDWRTPYAAASFAFDNNVATPDASKWIDQSLKAGENTANLYLKARMQAKAGDKAGAVKSAQAAVAKATPEQKDFVTEIQKSIAKWQ